jgi:hypothetical protein
MRLFFLFCVVLLFYFTNIYSQNNYNTISERNIDIFSRLIDNGLNDLENQLVIAGKDKLFLLRFPEKSIENNYLFLKLKQKFSSYNLLTGNSSQKADYEIVFENPKLNTNYSEIFSSTFLGSKRVKRKIQVGFLHKIIDNSTKEEIYSHTFNESNEDDFLLDDHEYVEISNYGFTKSILPDESLFQQVLIPALVVGASAVAIILFFVIRSK